MGIYTSALVSASLQGTIYFVNNTIVNPRTSSEYAGIWFNGRGGSTGNFIIQNNVLYKGSTYKGICAYYWDDASYLSFDYNVYYNSDSWRLNGLTYTTIDTWRRALGGAGAGNDSNSIVSDPNFVSYAAGNFKLQSHSPAATLGVDILNLAGGGTSARIPAGAYITGNEIIGRITITPAPPPPTGLRIIQ